MFFVFFSWLASDMFPVYCTSYTTIIHGRFEGLLTRANVKGQFAFGSLIMSADLSITYVT